MTLETFQNSHLCSLKGFGMTVHTVSQPCDSTLPTIQVLNILIESNFKGG